MVSIWLIGAGALAVAATAVVLRRSRRGGITESSTAIGPVSEEWLSQARGQADQGW